MLCPEEPPSQNGTLGQGRGGAVEVGDRKEIVGPDEGRESQGKVLIIHAFLSRPCGQVLTKTHVCSANSCDSLGGCLVPVVTNLRTTTLTILPEGPISRWGFFKAEHHTAPQVPVSGRSGALRASVSTRKGKISYMPLRGRCGRSRLSLHLVSSYKSAHVNRTIRHLNCV